MKASSIDLHVLTRKDQLSGWMISADSFRKNGTFDQRLTVRCDGENFSVEFERKPFAVDSSMKSTGTNKYNGAVLDLSKLVFCFRVANGVVNQPLCAKRQQEPTRWNTANLEKKKDEPLHQN